MTATDREGPRRAPAASRWYSWFLGGVTLCFACGGKSASHGASQVSGTGGTEPAAGGSGASEAGAGARSEGGTTQQAGGAAGAPLAEGGMAAVIQPGGRGGAGGPEGGAAGGASVTCSVNSLLNAIEIPLQQPIATCAEASPTLGPNESLSRRRGAVVIDDDGRVVDITGVSGDTKQEWLDNLADQRWPCLAGRTVGYSCTTFQ